jgi:hypothetical protein
MVNDLEDINILHYPMIQCSENMAIHCKKSLYERISSSDDYMVVTVKLTAFWNMTLVMLYGR